MIEKAPIIFRPYFKSVLWGGEKICAYKIIKQEQPNIGESWEISGIPGNESVVAIGKYKGMSMSALIDKFGAEFLGDKVIEKYGGKFPLLIKFIDANRNLSVQVHPDDNLAGERHETLGKSEMWYIIRAEKDAKIYSGFKLKLTPEDYEKRVEDGTFAETLATHDSFADDVFILPPGRVHAIGAGNLLAEIQEASDITYRIYDYNRKDANGELRELHTDLAKDAIDFTVYDNYKSEKINDNIEDTLIGNCEHFKTKRLLIRGEKNIKLNESSFQVIICIEGEVLIQVGEHSTILKEGHTVLIPAVTTDISLKGNAKLLLTGYLL